MKQRIAAWLMRLVLKRTLVARPADVVIGGAERPYMHRWFLIPRNRIFNIYVHFFMRSDDDRALHDHPWWNVSFLLEGSYVEHTIDAGGVHRRRMFEAGDLKARCASAAHRIELLPDDTGRPQPVWTLFMTGPKIRSWGFHCPNGWRHWRDYTKPGHPGEIGRGCD